MFINPYYEIPWAHYLLYTDGTSQSKPHGGHSQEAASPVLSREF